MENEKKRLSHYVPAELVDRFNKRADEREPALQRQVYFEEIIRLGLVAEKVLPDLIKAAKFANMALSNTPEHDNLLWKHMADLAVGYLNGALLVAEDEGLEI